jgi:PAS domain S-box-containing protein
MDNDSFTHNYLESNCLYFNVFKILPEPAILLAADSPLYTVIDANEAFESMIGIFEGEYIGTSSLDMFDKAGLSNIDWADLMEKAISEQVPVEISGIRYQGVPDPNRDGASQVDLAGRIVPVLGRNQLVIGILCIFTDKTASHTARQTEKDLLAAWNTKLFQEVQRFERIGTWEANLTDNTIFWSDLTKEIYEVSEDFTPSFEEVIEFFDNDIDRQSFISQVKELMENGGVFEAELFITTGKGSKRLIRISGQAGYTMGHCERIYGAIQDITEKRRAENLLHDSRRQFESLIQSVRGIFWEADAEQFEFSFVSDHVKDILGHSPKEWLEERYFWENHIHPDDRQQAVSYCMIQSSHFKDHTFDYRMIRADGNVVWIKDVVSVIREEGQPVRLRGIMLDITETKRKEELAVLEKRILELNTDSDTSMHELLLMYLKGIEGIFPGMQCSLHKVKEDRLELALAPSIPPAYFLPLYNEPIGPLVGSCGTAAFLKERVVVSDIANDRRWDNYREHALQYHLRACWSQPIISSDGLVLATLGFYYNKVKYPNEDELAIIERCAAILKIIMENRQKTVLLEEASVMMKQGQGLAGFGNWQWDILNDFVKWSDELYTIYGLDKTSFKATFAGYQELLHPDDRDRVRDLITKVLRERTDVVFEERIVRPNGEIRHLKSWGRIQLDEKGIPVKMIGACLDVTESRQYTKAIEQQNENLRNIAFVQSHVVRAPLARLMGAIGLIKNYINSEQENKQILEYILASAEELDKIIREISDKTHASVVSVSEDYKFDKK